MGDVKSYCSAVLFGAPANMSATVVIKNRRMNQLKLYIREGQTLTRQEVISKNGK